MRGFCPNFEICMGCFVHLILLGVGCFFSLQKKTCGGFCPPITKWTWGGGGGMSVGCFVRIPDQVDTLHVDRYWFHHDPPE